MKAYICDRCKKAFTKPDFISREEIKLKRFGFHSYEEEYVDLCPECYDEFEKWLYNKEGESIK